MNFYEAFVSVFGSYAPIDGCPDYAYIGAVALFLLLVYCIFRLIGALIRR